MCNFTALFRELLLLKEWMVARYCEVLRFAPSRGRELKWNKVVKFSVPSGLPPRGGVN